MKLQNWAFCLSTSREEDQQMNEESKIQSGSNTLAYIVTQPRYITQGLIC